MGQKNRVQPIFVIDPQFSCVADVTDYPGTVCVRFGQAINLMGNASKVYSALLAAVTALEDHMGHAALVDIEGEWDGDRSIEIARSLA